MLFYDMLRVTTAQDCSNYSSGVVRHMYPAERVHDLMGPATSASAADPAGKHASVSGSRAAAAAVRCRVAKLLCTSSSPAQQLEGMNSELSACSGVQRQRAAPAPALLDGSSFTKRQPRSLTSLSPPWDISITRHQHHQQRDCLSPAYNPADLSVTPSVTVLRR